MATTTAYYAFNNYTTIVGSSGSNTWTNPTGPLDGGSGAATSVIAANGVGPRDYLAYGWAGSAQVPSGMIIDSIELRCYMKVAGTSGFVWPTDVKMEKGNYSTNGADLWTSYVDIGDVMTPTAWGLDATETDNLIHNQISSDSGIRVLMEPYSAYGGTADTLYIQQVGIDMRVTYSAPPGSLDIIKASF